MKIDINDIFSSHTGVLDFDLTSDGIRGITETGMIPDYVRIPDDGIRVTGQFRSAGEFIYLSASVTVRYKTDCDRCLREIDGETSFDLRRSVAVSGGAGRGQAVPDDGVDEEDVIAATDGVVDMDPVLAEEIALMLPTHFLCSEDCPGLCPVCGRLRSDPECKCAEKKEIDPRLAILKKLLDNSEEV